MRIKRRFVQVGDRRVHYLRAGEGPPVVLIHSSPANAWLLVEEIERLAKDYTVFAPDTPGFGLSQALPLDPMTVADLADALADTLAAMEMPTCPMFGSHTGAAIALEFGARHPDRITGLVLDGVPAFTPEEYQALFGDYFRPFPVTDLGGQYAEVWTRFRDQSIWFPWSGREPENLNAYDLGAPQSTHLWASMYFEAADTYKPAYRAALKSGPDALIAAAKLTKPAIYTATETDMLFPHISRLPPLKPGQEVRNIGSSYAAKRELIAEGFKRFGGAVSAPPDHDEIGSSRGLGRQFVDARDGGQLHLRYAGSRSSPPLLLLHDAPGSAAQWEVLILALSQSWFVIAPDLPGTGQSDLFVAGQPSMRDYVDEISALLDWLRIPSVHAYGIGFGASVALAIAAHHPERVVGVALRGLLLPDAEERRDLAAEYSPSIEIDRDGGHWYRTWLMLRDSLVWWPWYDRRKTALRRAPTDFDAQRLHDWTVDVMRSRHGYAHLIHAALDDDAAITLTELAVPLLRLHDPLVPLCRYDEESARLRPDAAALRVNLSPPVHAKDITHHFRSEAACAGKP